MPPKPLVPGRHMLCLFPTPANFPPQSNADLPLDAWMVHLIIGIALENLRDLWVPKEPSECRDGVLRGILANGVSYDAYVRHSKCILDPLSSGS